MTIRKTNNYYDEDIRAIVATYEGFLSHEQFKAISSETLGLMQETGCRKILVNTRELRLVSAENQQWIETFWFPAAMKLGLYCMAFIVPTNVFGKVSVKNTNKTAERELPIEIRYFNEEATATEWIRTQHNGQVTGGEKK